MNNWRPIETAPKDGTWILAYGEGYKQLDPQGRWFTREANEPLVPTILIIWWHELWFDGEVDLGGGIYRKERKLSHAGWDPAHYAFRPTHWMPLPPAPSTLPHPPSPITSME
jgi:hypothetical protein